MNYLLNASPRAWPWITVIVICVCLELGALYFQEFLGLYPCELCIYTRVWMSAIVLVALLGIFLRGFVWPRRAITLGLLGLTLGLAHTTWQLLGLEYGWNIDGACSLVANFPSWARLDEWFPTMFLVQDACTATPMVVFGLTMAEGLAGVCLGFFAGMGVALYGDFKHHS